jgi:hypothetical protein
MTLGSIVTKILRDRLTKTKNPGIFMGTLVGGFLFGDFGVLFWFLDEPAPTMWIWVWGLFLLVGLDLLAYAGIDRLK